MRRSLSPNEPANRHGNLCSEMRYGLRCPVTSKIRLSKPERKLWGDLTVELTTNSDGYFSQASVIASGQNAAEYQGGATIDHVAKVFRIQANRNEELHARMMLALHSLESFLCFWGNLEAIHWNQAEAFIEPESEEEEKGLDLRSWMMMPAINDPIVDLSPEQLELIVGHAESCSAMTTTLSFHRAGVNDIRRFEYISAFFNFYFVLEGLYANGRFKTDHVKHEFANSVILVAAIESIIAEGFPQAMGEDVSVSEMLRAIGKPCDARSLIHLLVHTRGDLHHYAGAKKKPTGSPLMNDRYRSLSQFCLRVSQSVLFSELTAMDPLISVSRIRLSP